MKNKAERQEMIRAMKNKTERQEMTLIIQCILLSMFIGAGIGINLINLYKFFTAN